MAKTNEPNNVNPDVNELVAFEAAFDANKGDIRKLTTRKGRLRGGMGPADRAAGIKLLKSYGL